MDKSFRRLISYLIIVITLFGSFSFVVACSSNEVINSYEYVEDGFSYDETYNFIPKYYRTFSVVTDYATYNFDEEISLDKRNRFVTFADELLNHLGYGESTDRWLIFFVSDDIKTPRADNEEDCLYFSPSNTKSIEFISYVLQALNTNTLAYGLLYGLSARIYTELGWGKVSTVSDFFLKSFLKKDKNRFVLDLTYPVFHKKFASNKQIKYAKSISIKLVNYIEKTHGKEAFDKLFDADLTLDLAFDNLFYGYLNDWLATLKIDGITLSNEVLKCIPYTADFPYRLITNSCDYYMGKDWKDNLLKEMFYTYKDFDFSYYSVKSILLEREHSYKNVRAFFEYTGDRRYPVLLQNISEYSSGSANEKYIVINSMFSLTHEYAHFTSFIKYGMFPSWIVEAVAYYCQITFDDFYSSDYYQAYHNTKAYIKAVGEISEYTLYVLDNYVNASDNENYYTRYLEGAFYDMFFKKGISLHEKFAEYKTDARYFGVGFSDFLIKTYGKEKYLKLYENFGNLTYAYNKTEAELIDEYLTYLYDIFN